MRFPTAPAGRALIVAAVLAGVAAVLAGKVQITGPTVAILSGGNVAPETFAQVMAGGMW